jgi:hypothetical protein
MGHTPGPWRYEPETKTIRSEPANYWLATMDSWDGAINNEDNARLMAAAPEMFDICKRAQVAEFMANGYTDFYREIGALIDRVQGVSK